MSELCAGDLCQLLVNIFTLKWHTQQDCPPVYPYTVQFWLTHNLDHRQNPKSWDDLKKKQARQNYDVMYWNIPMQKLEKLLNNIIEISYIQLLPIHEFWNLYTSWNKDHRINIYKMITYYANSNPIYRIIYINSNLKTCWGDHLRASMPFN